VLEGERVVVGEAEQLRMVQKAGLVMLLSEQHAGLIEELAGRV
jgi:hypothetical protein